MKLQYEKMFKGYKKEEKFRTDLIKILQKSTRKEIRELVEKLNNKLTPYDEIRLSKAYKENNEDLNIKINYLLYKMNNDKLKNNLKKGNFEKIINNAQENIRNKIEQDIITTFKNNLIQNNFENQQIDINSELLDDFTMLELDYIEDLNILEKSTINGVAYKFNEEYLKKLKSEGK